MPPLPTAIEDADGDASVGHGSAAGAIPTALAMSAAAARAAAGVGGATANEPGDSTLLESYEWSPPAAPAPRPVAIDAALVRSLRAADGRSAREVLGAVGWSGVEALLEAYRSSSIGFEGALAVLAQLLGMALRDVHEQLRLGVLEREARSLGLAMSAEAKAAREQQKEEARMQREITKEIKAVTGMMLRAVETGGGDALGASVAYASERARSVRGKGGAGSKLTGAAASEARKLEDEVWEDGLACLPARDGVPSLLSICTVAVARQSVITVAADGAAADGTAVDGGGNEGAAPTLDEIRADAASAARHEWPRLISRLRAWRRTRQVRPDLCPRTPSPLSRPCPPSSHTYSRRCLRGRNGLMRV